MGCSTLAPLPTAKLFPEGPSGASASVDTSAPGDTDDPDDTRDPDDSGGPDDPDVDPADLSTPEELETAIRLLLVDNPPNGRGLIDFFIEQTLQGDAGCPGEDLAFTSPESSCTSSTGWEYFGYAPYVSQVEDSPAGGTRQRVEIAQISFVITAPDGSRFAAGGGFAHLQDLDTEERAWTQSFSGTYTLTGDGPAWIQAGTQLGWEFEGARPTGAHRFTVSGPIAVGSTWLYVDRIHWDESVCDGIPEVQMRVRDLEGRWYVWASGADCSSCGEVAWDNPDGDPLALGEICIDLSDQMAALDANSNFNEGG